MEVPQIQADLERTETYFIQHDVIRGHAERLPFAVPVDILALVIKRGQFTHDLVNRQYRTRLQRPNQIVGHTHGTSAKGIQTSPQTVSQPLFGKQPTTRIRFVPQSLQMLD